MFLWTWLSAANSKHKGGQLSYISFRKHNAVLIWCIKAEKSCWGSTCVANLWAGPWDGMIVGASLEMDERSSPRGEMTWWGRRSMASKTSRRVWLKQVTLAGWFSRNPCTGEGAVIASHYLSKNCLYVTREALFFFGLSGHLKHHYVQWSLRNRAPSPVQPSIKPLDCYDLRWQSLSKGPNWKKLTPDSVGICWASRSHCLKVNSIRFQAENERERVALFFFSLSTDGENQPLHVKCVLVSRRVHSGDSTSNESSHKCWKEEEGGGVVA